MLFQIQIFFMSRSRHDHFPRLSRSETETRHWHSETETKPRHSKTCLETCLETETRLETSSSDHGCCRCHYQSKYGAVILKLGNIAPLGAKEKHQRAKSKRGRKRRREAIAHKPCQTIFLLFTAFFFANWVIPIHQ